MPNYLTQTDVQNYGSELVDFSMRAAAHAVAPQLQELRETNQQLQRRLAREARHRMDAQVERAVPDYRTIDQDPAWHRYLLSTDPLSGLMRQRVLNDAIAKGSAERVVAFFNSFKQQHGASSGAQAPAGRTGSAYSGGKPLYTRDNIRQNYEAHRKGAFAGREAEWARWEQDMIAAAREGRIKDPVDLQGK
jgi:hypothetical protein